MKKIGLLSVLILTLAGCRNERINGTIAGYDTDSLFLYKAKNESAHNMTFLKSIPVAGGKFVIDNDSLRTGLYCLSLQNTARGESADDYVFLFLEPVKMDIAITRGDNNSMAVLASGSAIEDRYAAFAEARRHEKNRVICDSLRNMFYEAREENDTTEMRWISELSETYYNEARAKLEELIDAEIKKHDGTYFALYLYGSYVFPDEEPGTPEEIARIRKYVNSFDKASRESDCYNEIEEALGRYEKCATGCEAPGITGTGEDGNTISLSDFRGKYVLVDFWSSGCTWCRLETPILQRTYRDFKDKGFTILGVSSDNNEAHWKKAIQEDESFWNQILLHRDSINAIMNSYCIKGIPHIILINPQGVIIAKDLRGDRIYDAVKENVRRGD